MTRVLIGEPSTEVRDLLVRVIRLLGHEPLVSDAESASAPVPDVLVVEPAETAQLELARALRGRAPDLPIVFCSILPPNDETRALSPVAHVLKPFRRSELEQAVGVASSAA